MNSLVYLVLTEVKNSLKELVHKPGKLVLYLFVVVLIVGLVVMSLFPSLHAETAAPLFWLRGIYFAFVVLFTIIAVQKGLTSGDAIFEMSDVNLLFVSPVNPRTILLYGIVRLAKVSFLAGLFILFQSNSLANFGVGFGGILVLFFIFILTMVVLSVLSLVIYSATNGKPRGKRWARVIAVLVFIPLLVHFALQFFAQGNLIAALENTLQSPALSAVPIAGWATAGAMALLSGNLGAGIGWLLLLVLAGAGMVAYVMLSRSDYYEDVLVATETAFEKKRAAEEGDLHAATITGRRVKVTRTGIGGWGASALFYKHLRETFRQNRLGFFSLYTIILFVCVLVMSIFLRGEMGVAVVLQILMWIQLFMIGNGRGLKELYTHYIYLMPEPPLRKIIWSNMELVFKTLLESVLLLLIPGIILLDNPLLIAGSMLTYTLFSFLLLGINYLSMRWTQANLSAGLLLVVYYLAVIVILLPGLVPALIVGFVVGGVWGTLLGFLILSGWELVAGFICFALSRSILNNCDMPSVKQVGK